MLRFIFIAAVLFFCQYAFAQQPVVAYDTSSITQRDFNNAAIEKYKSDPAFQYYTVIETPKSWWTRFWAWVWQKLGSFFETESGRSATNLIFIILAVIVLALAAWILTGMSNAGIFGKKNKEETLDYSITEDNIHEINFDAALEKAISNGNFRLAVRLLYLQTLKNLTDAGKINWQPNKTNITYVNELNGNKYQQDFRNLTWQFENNWYGDLPIDATEFQLVRNQFNFFNQNLS